MIWTVAGVGCDEIVRANPRGRSYSRWHGFGATESPAINSSTVFISLIRLSDSLYKDPFQNRAGCIQAGRCDVGSQINGILIVYKVAS